MLSFTGNLILWILCILFRLFVVALICGGIYKLYKWIKDKIDDKIIDINWKAAKKEQAEKERLSHMTEEQIKEEKQIDGELKFTIIVCGVIISLVILIILIKKY